MPLILASTSPIRRAMLDQAGIAYETMKPMVDEDVIKARHGGDGETLARHLAEAKAISVEGDGYVIGSDSVVSVDGRLFDKPETRAQAAEHLRYFSGRLMGLSSAVAIAKGGQVDWVHGETAWLRVRELSDAFIEHYLEAEWPEVAYCVGVFRMEGPGVNLFETMDGSYFTILGMPLLPLLGALRRRGVLQQ
ncbi:Maf family protein [Sphingomicrobium astaxanthinifaciens]|uniref:Maf family protein n=1 Tax=Sphingomicrobium astaxanthinifaciens TaxID=1227949 RepID=UPI001FCBBD88|nr:Maf family protein [Sphingomicrobium astaxanthinifaciens]MCJ7421172.1 Maf family protein [Sphingomicrobium astaxanthinifaciens]